MIGFSSRYVREPLARLFYTEAHDPVAAALPAKHSCIRTWPCSIRSGFDRVAPEFPHRRTWISAWRGRVREATGG